nr:immunoglobulin heavy chain junction region [Macaca mulatta]
CARRVGPYGNYPFDYW